MKLREKIKRWGGKAIAVLVSTVLAVSLISGLSGVAFAADYTIHKISTSVPILSSSYRLKLSANNMTVSWGNSNAAGGRVSLNDTCYRI